MRIFLPSVGEISREQPIHHLVRVESTDPEIIVFDDSFSIHVFR